MFCPHSGHLFWPSNDGTEHPDAERLEDNRVINNPPVLPDYQEEEEEIDIFALEVERMVAQIRRDVDNANGHGGIDGPNRRGEERDEQLNHNDELNAGPPSPSPQQFPAPSFGMDWRQQGPVYNPELHANPHALPFAFPFVYPYAQPFAFPYAPPAFFNADLHPDLHAPPQAEPHVLPEIENIGPLSAEQSLDFFSDGGCLEEDSESPSTSGSSAKRRREESDEREAKRLRWSDDALHG